MAMDRAVGIVPAYAQGSEYLFCLVQHADGHWGFPKGHVDSGENDEAAARRELREEAGIAEIMLVANAVFSETYSYERDGIRYEKEVQYFLGIAGSMEGRRERAFENEIRDVRWLPYEAALNTLTFEGGKKILRESYAALHPED